MPQPPSSPLCALCRASSKKEVEPVFKFGPWPTHKKLQQQIEERQQARKAGRLVCADISQGAEKVGGYTEERPRDAASQLRPVPSTRAVFHGSFQSQCTRVLTQVLGNPGTSSVCTCLSASLERVSSLSPCHCDSSVCCLNSILPKHYPYTCYVDVCRCPSLCGMLLMTTTPSTHAAAAAAACRRSQHSSTSQTMCESQPLQTFVKHELHELAEGSRLPNTSQRCCESRPLHVLTHWFLHRQQASQRLQTNSNIVFLNLHRFTGLDDAQQLAQRAEQQFTDALLAGRAAVTCGVQVRLASVYGTASVWRPQWIPPVQGGG